MSKVLITGGAGFIGSNLARLLLDEGREVTIYDNLSSGYRQNLEGLVGARFVEGDVRDALLLTEAMRGAEAVCHLAASVGNTRSIENPVEDSEINVIGTLRILEAARMLGVRKIVFSDSAGIFGELKYLPIREDHPVEPDSPYGASKLAAEKLCLAYAKLYDLDAVCLRYFNVYGVNQRYDAYGNVIPIFARRILRGETVTVFGDGEQTRDFVNVRDVARANFLALEVGGVSAAFNIASAASITINRLVELMSEAADVRPSVEHAPPRKGDVRHSRATSRPPIRLWAICRVSTSPYVCANTCRGANRTWPERSNRFYMKIAVVSCVLPPSWSGQAILIYRLLKDRSPEEYCLISQEDYAAAEDTAAVPKLAGRYYRLSPWRQIPGGHFLDTVKRLNIYLLGRQIASIARREQCSAIVAFTGNLNDLPASLLASRILKVPCYAYVCDFYSYQQVAGRAFAEQTEAKVLHGAAGVVVPNEFLRDELKRRYAVDSTVIYNPCDLQPYEAAPAFREHDGEQRIVYTGAVYAANYDAFRNLIGAIELLGRSDIRLHLFTAQSPKKLRKAGIRGPVVFHEHVNVAEMPAIQKQADLLFLPLAFDSPYPEIIRTSAPFKMGEYLAAQRPVLVHAPADSFITWYFRDHDCGFVVDENDPAKLADGIKRLLCDTGLGQKLCERASERARAEFSDEISQGRFAQLLELAKGGV